MGTARILLESKLYMTKTYAWPRADVIGNCPGSVDTNEVLAVNVAAGRFQGRFLLAFFLRQLLNSNFCGWADAFANAMHVTHYGHW
eukprot:scaffold67716_cov34-Attheya_sp.AAC.2